MLHLGVGIASMSVAEGLARVVVSGRDQAAIDDVVYQIRAQSGTAIGELTDVTRAADLEALRETTERELGPAGILLAFAGGGGAPSPASQPHR